MRFTGLILTLFISFNCLSQVTPRDRASGNPLDQFTWSNLTDKTRTWGQPSDDYDGSPYFIDEWKKASLQTIDNKNYLEVSLKLDLFNKRLLFLDKITGDSIIIVDEFVREFILEDGDTSYHFQKVLTSKSRNFKAFVFYIILADGNHALMLRPEKRLISESTSGGLANSTGTSRDEYKDLSSYFIYSRDQRNLSRIKPNLKSLLKAVDGHEYELRNYVEKNELELDNKEHLIKLFAYYNTL